MKLPSLLWAMLRRSAAPSIIMTALLLSIVGCDAGPMMGQVSGVVTNSGAPVSTGTVIFFPVSSGPMAQGQLDREGRYSLTTKTPNDGTLVGDYLVAIVPPTDVDVLLSELKPGQMQRKTTYDSIPKHVRNHTTSGLTASVAAGLNQLDFDLARAIRSTAP